MNVGECIERKGGASRAAPAIRCRIGAKAQGDARASSGGRLHHASDGGRSRDRGCKGHRILRRVPIDGRHPGPSQASAVTRRRTRWSWRLGHPRPASSRKREQAAHGREGVRSTRAKVERRQGCQRLGRDRHRGNRTPTLVRKPQGSLTRNRVLDDDPLKRSWTL
jgi:hypothetical protein